MNTCGSCRWQKNCHLFNIPEEPACRRHPRFWANDAEAVRMELRGEDAIPDRDGLHLLGIIKAMSASTREDDLGPLPSVQDKLIRDLERAVIEAAKEYVALFRSDDMPDGSYENFEATIDALVAAEEKK